MENITRAVVSVIVRECSWSWGWCCFMSRRAVRLVEVEGIAPHYTSLAEAPPNMQKFIGSSWLWVSGWVDRDHIIEVLPETRKLRTASIW